MNSREFISVEETLGAHNYHPLDVIISEAKGIWVWDVVGNKYLDFLSAYSALNQGHCHPKIYNAMIEQAKKVTLTSRAFRNDQLAGLYLILNKISGLPKILPMNSGAEAVETALKAARKWAYQIKGVTHDKAEIIACENNFHGRTITIVGCSTEDQYKNGYGPFTPGFKVIPYGDIKALENAITPNTAAFLFEPIQGEGGILIPEPGFLKAAENLCRENNVLFIADEIQTGLGRTGKMFAYEHEDVKPDGVIIGKALSGGFYPISAFISNEEIMSVFTPGDHGSTFGGNPLASAIGKAALEVIIEEKLPEKAEKLGNYFMDKLKSIQSPYIKEIRGRGLLIGVELKPEAGGARRFCEALKSEGILAKETHHHVIRFAPPLVITEDEIKWAFERIEKVLSS